MYSSAKELRFQTKELLETVARGEEIIITFRGKPYAKLVPLKNSKKETENSDKLFGIWKDRDDVKNVKRYVRELRKGRYQ